MNFRKKKEKEAKTALLEGSQKVKDNCFREHIKTNMPQINKNKRKFSPKFEMRVHHFDPVTKTQTKKKWKLDHSSPP